MNANDDDLMKELRAELARLTGGKRKPITTMPFGNFEGMSLRPDQCRIPRHYLKWLLTAFPLSWDLRRAIEAVVHQ